MVTLIRNLHVTRLIFAAAILTVLLTGCAPSLPLIMSNFYDYRQVTKHLQRMQTNHSDVIHLETPGTTYEGRAIMGARLGRAQPSSETKPAILAIFTEHGNEHDTTNLGIGIIDKLASRYGHDQGVTHLLDTRDLWIVPMMNPDGAEYDFSGSVRPFSWRKNRRPITGQAIGVDLNRNWGRVWDSPIPKGLEKDLSDPSSHSYSGDQPFSEKETRAVRDFLHTHREVQMFVDYHSGKAFFLQGGVGFPIPPEGFRDPCHREILEHLAQGFSDAVNNPDDSRSAFVVSKERDVAPTIRKHAPWYVKLFIPKSILAAPGTSGEWVYGALGIPVLGVEIMRDSSFIDNLPESMQGLVSAQTRGIVFLLEKLSGNPFDCRRTTACTGSVIERASR